MKKKMPDDLTDLAKEIADSSIEERLKDMEIATAYICLVIKFGTDEVNYSSKLDKAMKRIVLRGIEARD